MGTVAEPQIAPAIVPQPARAVAELVARILLAPLFLVAGVSKISALEATEGYILSVGLPAAILPVVIAVEIIGAVALLIGWKTRAAAGVLGGFSVLAAAVFHGNLADQVQLLHFFKNLSIAGGLLVIAVNGAGPFSIDRLRP